MLLSRVANRSAPAPLVLGDSLSGWLLSNKNHHNSTVLVPFRKWQGQPSNPEYCFAMASLAITSFMYFTFSGAFAGNLLVIYMVFFHSPSIIRTYKYSVFLIALTDLVGSIAILFSQSIVLPIDESLIFICYGPVKYFSPTACLTAGICFIHCANYNMWTLLISFGYRYQALFVGDPRKSVMISLYTGIYVLPFSALMLIVLTSDDPSQLLLTMINKAPTFDIEDSILSGFVTILRWNVFIPILIMTLPIFPVIATIIILRRRILKQIELCSFSAATKQIHHELIKALTFQACVPLFYLLSVIVYVLEQTGLVHSETLLRIGVTSMSLIHLISPLGTIYFVKPYRVCIMKKLHLKIKEINPAYFNTRPS